MPTRKQRKRSQKERRHEYETVWVDSEGNELDEPPDDAPPPAPRERRPDGKKPQQKRSSAAARTPMPPDWRRAARRSLILGAVIFVFFALVTGPLGAFVLAILYTGLFIPFTYYLDRFAYSRYLKKVGQQPKKR